jgi:hypothetical protein
MPDLGSTLLLYSLRVSLVSLEPVPNSGGRDYSDLKNLLRRHVLKLENELSWSNDEGWMAPDSACLAEPALSRPLAKADSGRADSVSRGMPPASSLISIAKAMLRTLESSSEFPAGSSALQKLREAVAEIIVELAPAAKREPKFELRTGPDLYSRKAG